MSGPGILQVHIFKEGEFLGTEVFIEKQIQVGRDEDTVDLFLESSSVSRLHAKILIKSNKVHVEDLGSRNGVLVNGEKVEKCIVKGRDEVEIGVYSLRFKYSQKKSEGTSATDEATGEISLAAAAELTVVQAKADFEEEHTRIDASPRLVDEEQKKPVLKAKGNTKLEAKPKNKTKAKTKAAKIGLSTKSSTAQLQASDLPKAFDEDSVSQNLVALDDELSNPMHLAPEDMHTEEVYVAPFSLREKLEEGQRLSPGSVPEIVHLRGDIVVGSRLLKKGESFWVGASRWRRAKSVVGDVPRFVLAKSLGAGKGCKVSLPKDAESGLSLDGAKGHFSDGAKSRRGGMLSRVLSSSDALWYEVGDERFGLRFVQPPQLVVETLPLKERIKPSPITQKTFGASFGGHILAVIIFSLIVSAAPTTSDAMDDSFVEISLEPELPKEPELEAPPEPTPEPEPEPEPQRPSKERPRPKEVKRSKKPPKKGGTSSKPAGVLGMLSKRGGTTKGPASAVAAASNLSAAKVPGSTGGLRISGLQAQAPASKLSLGGGGGALNSRGASLLRGGAGGGGRLKGSGKKNIRGIVQKQPRKMRAAGQGQMDRAALERVINSNIGQVQRCYERELMRGKSIAGTLKVEWTIATTGRVSSVRQASSNIGSNAVSSCVLARIKTWKFPSPKGGSVVITYPFVFRGSTF